MDLIKTYRITLTSQQWQALGRETSWHFAAHHAPSCLGCGNYSRLAEIGRSTQSNPDDLPVTVDEFMSTVVTMSSLGCGLGLYELIWEQFYPQLVEADRVAKAIAAERTAQREQRRAERRQT